MRNFDTKRYFTKSHTLVRSQNLEVNKKKNEAIGPPRPYTKKPSAIDIQCFGIRMTNNQDATTKSIFRTILHGDQR